MSQTSSERNFLILPSREQGAAALAVDVLRVERIEQRDAADQEAADLNSIGIPLDTESTPQRIVVLKTRSGEPLFVRAGGALSVLTMDGARLQPLPPELQTTARNPCVEAVVLGDAEDATPSLIVLDIDRVAALLA